MSLLAAPAVWGLSMHEKLQGSKDDPRQQTAPNQLIPHTFTYFFTRLLGMCLLSTYHVPGSVRDTRERDKYDWVTPSHLQDKWLKAPSHPPRCLKLIRPALLESERRW